MIQSTSRNEKIKNFFVQNKKLLVASILFIVLILLSFYLFKIYENKHREALSNKFNTSLIDYKNGDKNKVVTNLKEVINEKLKNLGAEPEVSKVMFINFIIT